jgi:hypothetical protein
LPREVKTECDERYRKKVWVPIVSKVPMVPNVFEGLEPLNASHEALLGAQMTRGQGKFCERVYC